MQKNPRGFTLSSFQMQLTDCDNKVPMAATARDSNAESESWLPFSCALRNVSYRNL